MVAQSGDSRGGGSEWGGDDHGGPVDYGDILPRLDIVYGPRNWGRLTWGTFQRYIEDIPIYQAERMMMLAQVAMFPRVKQSARNDIWRTWKRQAERVRDSVLSFNGVKVTRLGLKRALAGVSFGGNTNAEID